MPDRFLHSPALYPSADHWHGTTIISVRKNDRVVIAGDGQVTAGATVIKGAARKVRRLPNHGVITGFAGATADALALFERLEEQLSKHPGQLTRACVELAKQWRMDRNLRRLDAMMAVCDKDVSLMLTGAGDVVEPDDGLIALGSGGAFALAAARALMGKDENVADLCARDIAQRAMAIAAEICVYTNDQVTIEEIPES
ncbi:MAG: ATP-dependent protease subunit HslV [Pseudomonadota bacterium]